MPNGMDSDFYCERCGAFVEADEMGHYKTTWPFCSRHCEIRHEKENDR